MTSADDAQAYADPMPVFTIKAKDKLAIRAVAAYLRLCEELGLDDQAAEVELAMAEIDSWRRRHPEQVKLPDHPHVPAAQPDAAPPPDGANAAGVDVYRKIATVTARKVTGDESVSVYSLEGPAKAHAGDWILTAQTGESWVVEGPIFESTYELTPTAAEMRAAEVEADRDAYRRERNQAERKRDEARRELAEAIRERDAALAKTDGGEWQWGVRLTESACDVWHDSLTMARLQLVDFEGSGAHLIRRWTGPVEPVTDDGGAS